MIVKVEENYFSETLKWMVVILSILIGVYLIYKGSYLWVMVVLLIISLIAFSTKYLLIIDPQKKLIIDSFYCLWIKIKNEEFGFMSLDNIRFDKQRHTYNASSRSREHTSDFSEYIATLEYDRNKSIELMRHMEYQSVTKKVKSISIQLNLPIIRTF
jgi:hypothetical protein